MRFIAAGLGEEKTKQKKGHSGMKKQNRNDNTQGRDMGTKYRFLELHARKAAVQTAPYCLRSDHFLHFRGNKAGEILEKSEMFFEGGGSKGRPPEKSTHLDTPSSSSSRR